MPDTDEDVADWRAIIAMYNNQSHVLHALWLLGGIATWIGSYVVIMHLTGWAALAGEDSTRAILARRNAGGAAGAVAGVYFAVMWHRAYGGLLLTILYLGVILAAMPDQVYTLLEPAPDLVRLRHEMIVHP